MDYPQPLQQYIDKGEFDESWSSPARNQFIFNLMKNRVKDKTVIETGSKSGVFTYAASILGASLSVGIEQDIDLVAKSNETIQAMGVSQGICHTFEYNALYFDYSYFDLTFCLGLLYNINHTDKKKLLLALSGCSWVLVECWLMDDGKDYPTETRIEENGKPFQWFPNRVGLQHLLFKYFDSFMEVTPKSFQGHKRENVYFVCQR